MRHSFHVMEELGAECDRLGIRVVDVHGESGSASEFLAIVVRYIEAREKELHDRRWIPVTERLPEDGVPVAIVADRGRTPDNRGVVAAGELYRGWWYHTLPGLVARRIADVTHWMPLPAPPMDDK